MDQTVRKLIACIYSARRLKMLGLVSEGTCSLRSIDEMPQRFLDFRNVPRTRMVDSSGSSGQSKKDVCVLHQLHTPYS